MDRAEQIARFQSQVPCPICGLDSPLSEHACAETREATARERQVAGETFCKAHGHVYTDNDACVVCGEPQPAENGVLGQSNHGWGASGGEHWHQDYASPFVARDATMEIAGKTYDCDIKLEGPPGAADYRTLDVQERFWNQMQQMTVGQHRLAHGARNTSAAMRGLKQAIVDGITRPATPPRGPIQGASPVEIIEDEMVPKDGIYASDIVADILRRYDFGRPRGLGPQGIAAIRNLGIP